jgi:hypothetical protein
MTKTLNPKTNQQAFNMAFRAIIKQRGPSINSEGTCVYRGPHGRRCAAGHFIPDNLYTPSMENRNVNNESVQAALPKLFAEDSFNFIASLQRAHDEAAFEFRARGKNSRKTFRSFYEGWMLEVAREYRLNVNVFKRV